MRSGLPDSAANMGTRGQLIFYWRGRRVIIYNHYDSYPCFMGAELFKQVAALLQRFHGDWKGACQYWGDLIGALRLSYTDADDEETHPFNQTHAFTDIEKALHSTSLLLVCEEEGLDIWIEFVWTVDLDQGSLAMISHGGQAEWSFVDIYRGRALKDKWIKEAEQAACRDDIKDDGTTGSTSKPFSEAIASAAAIKIQASVRRFLEESRGLRPGGVLMTLAAMRFRRAAAQHCHEC